MEPEKVETIPAEMEEIRRQFETPSFHGEFLSIVVVPRNVGKQPRRPW